VNQTKCPVDGVGRRTFIKAVAAGAATLHLPQVVMAQAAYPNKPVRVIIPYPPGGPTDIVGRIICQGLAETFHQPFTVENKAGASGMIGADVVAKAAADGYTLLINVSGHVINPSIYAKMAHDPIKDFKGITRLASTPIQLVVGESSPFRSVSDVVQAMRARPGKYTFASSSNGTPGHLMGELFNQIAKVDAVHVPYKGAAPALTDVVGGQVSFMFDSMPSSINLVKSGRLRALGVSSPTRVAALPNVPTFAEQGFPGLNLTTWYGFWAPARTPDEIVQRLYEATSKLLATPAIRGRIEEAMAVPDGEAPKKFDEFCQAEYLRYAAIVKQAGIKAE
jgi:tripartite-type tricarboxylate transporter receptor subunit TctC